MKSRRLPAAPKGESGLNLWKYIPRIYSPATKKTADKNPPDRAKRHGRRMAGRVLNKSAKKKAKMQSDVRVFKT